MKKLGFTLAEVLITLAIIGVVAALVVPSLNSSIQKNKVGPTLRKFVGVMANANQRILGDNDTDTLNSIFDVSNDLEKTPEEYYNMLSKYVSGVVRDYKIYATGNHVFYDYHGTTYAGLYDPPNVFQMQDGSEFKYFVREKPAIHNGSYKGYIAEIQYDINGFETKPNRDGKDMFHFYVDDNGSIIPAGGSAFLSAYTDGKSQEPQWKDSTHACNDKKVTDGMSCAGSVADNNWKVIYKY